MHFYWFSLGVLAVWRVTHLFQAEDGPWNVFTKFRALFGKGVVGELLDCFYCLSLWVSIPVAVLIAGSWKEGVLLWLALSGAAILLERISKRNEA